MKSQQIHNRRVSVAILQSVDPENFVPARLTAKALNDDSCWEEDNADFESVESLYALGTMNDDDSF